MASSGGSDRSDPAVSLPPVLVVGTGRAGRALAGALDAVGARVRTCHHDELPGTAADSTAADAGVVVLCVPDAHVAATADLLVPSADRVVVHVSGVLPLSVLAPHPRVASAHPLVAIPHGAEAAQRLSGAWWAVAGDPLAGAIVAALDGRSVDVAEHDRALYHATAVVASNHLVALMAQVERLARRLGVPAEAFWDLARGALGSVVEVGPADALTGPVARGDWATVRRHLEVLDAPERATYLALAGEAATLAGRELPDDLVTPDR